MLLLGTMPLVIFLIMSQFIGTHARYSTAATPFLAVLAAAGCKAIQPRALRWAACGCVIVVGLVGSVRYLQLLGSINTRLSASELACLVAKPGAKVLFSSSLLVDSRIFPAEVEFFPPIASDDSPTRYVSDLSSVQMLKQSHPIVYLRSPGSQWADGPLYPDVVRGFGYKLFGTIRSAPPIPSDDYLPELPDYFFLHMLSATRTGPPIEVWVTPAGGKALESIAPEGVDSWTGFPDQSSALAGLKARRHHNQ